MECSGSALRHLSSAPFFKKLIKKAKKGWAGPQVQDKPARLVSLQAWTLHDPSRDEPNQKIAHRFATPNVVLVTNFLSNVLWVGHSLWWVWVGYSSFFVICSISLFLSLVTYCFISIISITFSSWRDSWSLQFRRPKLFSMVFLLFYKYAAGFYQLIDSTAGRHLEARW